MSGQIKEPKKQNNYTMIILNAVEDSLYLRRGEADDSKDLFDELSLFGFYYFHHTKRPRQIAALLKGNFKDLSRGREWKAKEIFSS